MDPLLGLQDVSVRLAGLEALAGLHVRTDSSFPGIVFGSRTSREAESVILNTVSSFL